MKASRGGFIGLLILGIFGALAIGASIGLFAAWYSDKDAPKYFFETVNDKNEDTTASSSVDKNPELLVETPTSEPKEVKEEIVVEKQKIEEQNKLQQEAEATNTKEVLDKKESSENQFASCGVKASLGPTPFVGPKIPDIDIGVEKRIELRIFNLTIDEAQKNKDCWTKWSISKGTLPPGLRLEKIRTFDSKGEKDSASAYIFGIATTPGTYAFSIKAESPYGKGETSFSVKVK